MSDSLWQRATKETALDPGGWVENRFRMVEERLARIEETDEALSFDDDDLLDLASDRLTVAGLRARLAHFDPGTPVEGKDGGQIELWTGQTLDEDASTPRRAIYDKKVIVVVDAADQK